MTPPRVLVFAGLDPSGRAGLLADGDAISALGAQPVLCATAIAAQSSRRLVHREPVTRVALEAQACAALEDGPVAAVKIGMIGTRDLLAALHALLRGPLAGVPAVLDPVLETSRGGALFEGHASEILPVLADVALVTPNLHEAECLAGTAAKNPETMLQAARALARRGAGAVLLKGGHLEGAPADLLWVGAQERERWFHGERIPRGKRGTGCRLASAIAAGLALGHPLEASVEEGIRFVRGYLAT